MMKFLVELVLGRVASALDGYKTKIGGVGLILIGVVGLIGHYWPDTGIKGMDIERALDSISLGIATLGLGHKAEKAKQAILESRQ